VRNPLNPVIGEIFRCSWNYDDSEIVYIAEQLSHHPPVTAFTLYNIQRGYIINANLAPTYVKFYGNSADTNLNGIVRVHIFGKRFQEEVYEVTYPTLVVRGILFGTLTSEVIGKVNVNCKSTKYSASIHFKPKVRMTFALFTLQTMFRGKLNEISGKVKHANETLYHLSGFWDSVILLTSSGNKKVSLNSRC
jgi:hypothetical protein